MVRDVHEVDLKGSYIRSQDERELMTQASFLRAFVAHEQFLEEAFVHYMMRGKSTRGWAPMCFSLAPSEEHARKMLTGNARFVDWSTPDTVRKFAKLHFYQGEPFETVLSSAHSNLLDMKTLRNACAHLSSNTSDQLNALYSRHMGLAKPRVTPYELAMALGPGSVESFMTSSLRIIEQAADQIADFN